jgi:hypothetical protein
LTTLATILDLVPPEVRKGQVMPILRNHMQPLELDIAMQRCLARIFGQLVTVVSDESGRRGPRGGDSRPMWVGRCGPRGSYTAVRSFAAAFGAALPGPRGAGRAPVLCLGDSRPGADFGAAESVETRAGMWRSAWCWDWGMDAAIEEGWDVGVGRARSGGREQVRGKGRARETAGRP